LFVASISAGNSQGNNYAGILQFATNAADGTHTTAVTIDGSQRVGIGTTSPSYKLHVSGSTGIIRGESTGASFLSPSLDLYDSTHAVEVILTPASGLGALGTFSNHPLAFYTNNGEKARITSDGKLLVGTSSARAIGTQSLAIQNEGISFDTTGFSTCANRNDIYGPYIHLGKSRGTSVGSSTIVQSGDILGGIVFAGADGTDVNTQSGVITCEVDGTPSANNMPGRIVLSTTAGGAAYPTERRTIASSGENTRLQIESPNSGIAGFSIITNRGDNAGPVIYLGKSRGPANGGTTIVANGDILGEIRFAGTDGTDIESMGARIIASVDGTPGVNDMPGKIVFLTSADGSASPTERMRIKSAGTINFSNVSTYADNTAALAGGLVAGDVYRKSDGTLMITY
jgi:hypothetical protein